jgi:hypothetical protein
MFELDRNVELLPVFLPINQHFCLEPAAGREDICVVATGRRPAIPPPTVRQRGAVTKAAVALGVSPPEIVKADSEVRSAGES